MGQFRPHIARRIEAVEPSVTLAVTAKAKQLKKDGKDIINLAAGEPDFNTPHFIIEAAVDAMEQGLTKYTPVAGMPELKDTICMKLKRDNGLDYKPENIVVNVGAKHSLFNIFQAILDPGDEILLPEPSWVSYKEMAHLAEAHPVFVHTSEEDGYALHVDRLEEALTDKTRALLINSPCNPTGAVYTKENLQAIADFAVKHDLLVIADEIYENIIYQEAAFHSIAGLGKEIFDRTVTVNGLSKSFSMTGWRIGYIAAPVAIAKAVTKIQSHSTSNPVSFCQYASRTALENDGDFIETSRQTFQKRRDLLHEGISGIEGLSCFKPGGAFYIFPNISGVLGKTLHGKKIENSLDFCEHLLDTQHVAAVPGSAFGSDDHVRMSYATSDDHLKEAIKRIEAFVKG